MDNTTQVNRDESDEDHLLAYRDHCWSSSSGEVMTISTNETEVSMTPVSLAPHLRVIKPSRPSLTYERVE